MIYIHALGMGAPGNIIEYMSAQVAPCLLVINSILSEKIPSGRGSRASHRTSSLAWEDIACIFGKIRQHLVHCVGAL